MDPRLLHFYNRELKHLREMGGEFAEEFPKIAGRLGLDGFECADPYVERLLEGFAFLAARVQLKLDAEYPNFTQHLLEMVYPNYLAPIPSMAVVQLQPDLSEGALSEGFVVPRDSALRSQLGKGDQTPCEYRTAHDVTLWPLDLVDAEYLPNAAAVAANGAPDLPGIKAGIRLRLRTTAGLSFDQLALESLPLYLRGSEQVPMRLYEQLLGNAVAVVLQPTKELDKEPAPWYELVERKPIRRMGFDDREALLPYGPRSFQGYRLLAEYFAFPERYLFVELTGLGAAVRRCQDAELDVFVLLNRSDPSLEHVIDASNYALFCAPAINLFPKRADRIHLTEQMSEHHVVPDRTRPRDFEVYEVTGVVGYGTHAEDERNFLPFYACHDQTHHREPAAYHTVHRQPRALSSRQRRSGSRSSYVGSEVFVALVDGKEAPYATSLRQLAVNTLCTNRDLPLHMPIGTGKTDFTLESGAPVDAVRCLAGPTKPKPPYAQGNTSWRLINHLSLNYRSFIDGVGEGGAAALQQLLMLYGDASEAAVRNQIEGIRSLSAEPIVRRLPMPGMMSVGRGLAVSVTCDEAAFEGSSVFLLGAVLEQFFTKSVSINSFTETVVRTLDRGEIMRWPVRIGQRHTL